MKLEGAEATVKLNPAAGTAVKTRVRKRYRHPKLDLRLRRERTRSEAKIISTANANKISSPRFIAGDENAFTVTMQLAKGKQLKNAACNFALVGAELAKLHDAGIAHGDFTTSNVMVSSGKPAVIDFGLSFFTRKTEDFAVDLDLFEKTVNAKQFASFLKGYSAEKNNASAVLSQLDELKSRGRYKT